MARAAATRKQTVVPPGGESHPVRKPRSAAGLDRLIHERLRLAIVSALATTSPLSFTELKRLLRTTDGNLSVHARRLEGAGYITSTKSSEGRTPRTDYRLTPAGRAALTRYLDEMDALIAATRSQIAKYS